MSSLKRRNVPRCSAEELERLRADKNWNALWLQALPLVGFAIKKLLRKGRLQQQYLTDDLIQEANLAARKYVQSWDPNKGMFSTWLVNNLYRQLLQQISRNAKGMVGGRDAQGTTGVLHEAYQVDGYEVSDLFEDPLCLLVKQAGEASLNAALLRLSPGQLDLVSWIYGIQRKPGTLQHYVSERRYGVSSCRTAKRILADARVILASILARSA